MAAFFQTWFPTRGFSLINGNTLNSWFQIPKVSVENGIVAKAGGGKATATQLTAAMNRIATCATNADSVKLPPAVASMIGATIVVINDGAANAQVFGFGTDTIDAVATATGVVLSAAKRAVFYCPATGIWQSGRMDKTS